MSIQITFEFPLMISKSRKADKLHISIRNVYQFKNKNNTQVLEILNGVKKVRLSKQIPQSKNFSPIRVMNSFQASMQTLEVAGFVQNFLWQGSLNQVWGMINVVQIAVHTQLINTETPDNLQMFNQIMIQIAYFEILPDEGLSCFYFWNLIDGQYSCGESEDEEED